MYHFTKSKPKMVQEILKLVLRMEHFAIQICTQVVYGNSIKLCWYHSILELIWNKKIILPSSSLAGFSNWLTTMLWTSMFNFASSCTSRSVSYKDKNSAIQTHTNVAFSCNKNDVQQYIIIVLYMYENIL